MVEGDESIASFVKQLRDAINDEKISEELEYYYKYHTLLNYPLL